MYLAGRLERSILVEISTSTWVGPKNPNVWTVTEIFIQQEANARRSYFVHTSGRDQRANTGRKQRSLDSAGRIGFLAGSYGQMSRMDYIKQIASVL